MHTKVIARTNNVTEGRTDEVHSYNPLPTPLQGIKNLSTYVFRINHSRHEMLTKLH